VADAFDAMTTARPYRNAMPRVQAMQEMVACSGSQFDPDVVDAFVAAWDQGLLRWNENASGQRRDRRRRSA
jgi:HD-GYP domain-containing protein (c-di-GMP phosphodiesterase class II)